MKKKINELIFNIQVYLIGLISSLAVILKPMVAAAQLTNGNSAAIGSSFAAAENWIKLVFGPGMFLIGLAGVAIAHFMGNEKAHLWAFRVLVGGLIILLGEALWALISGWTGS